MLRKINRLISYRGGCIVLLCTILCLCTFGSAAAAAEQQVHVFTTDADFDRGFIINLNHDPNHDQLQLNDGIVRPLPFINVACSDRGTVVRVHTDTGQIMGEYRTAPEGRGLDPSRTTVDKVGNVWTANRGEADNNQGSIVKIGIAAGGIRCNADGTDNPDGAYLKEIRYNTCVDRNGDGLIRTSTGLGDILSWPDLGDGAGGTDGMVQDAEDECILLYQRLPDAPNARHVSVDLENDVWVAGYPGEPKMFYKLEEHTGEIIDAFDARTFGCGGYGGLVSNDVLWSASVYQKSLLRYDLFTGEGRCIPIPGIHGEDTTSYGLGVDSRHFIWNNLWVDNTITKIDPNTGEQLPGFPKPTGTASAPAEAGRGVDVTPDDNVWGANSLTHNVSRFDNNGNVLKVIDLSSNPFHAPGEQPTGVSVDAKGKVWVSNRDSSNIMRIDPKGGADGQGAVDLVVDLGEGARPYNYSDMTGIIGLGHPPTGYWHVVIDSEECAIWDHLSWTSAEDGKSSIKVKVRTAPTEIGLAGEEFMEVSNGGELTGVKGRFMEVRAAFVSKRLPEERNLPILYDLSAAYHALEMVIDIPDQEEDHGFPVFDLDDHISFNDPAGDPGDVIWSHSDVPEGWEISIDADNRVTVTKEEVIREPITVTFTATLIWNPDVCIATDMVTFIPNHPPEPVEPSFYCLWPPNHKYVDIPLYDFVTDPDGDPITIEILSITSDEPTAGNAKDKKAPDADPACIGTDTARVRAERDTNGDADGRVYVVTFLASDDRGGETEIAVELRVPLNKNDYNNGCLAVDSGQYYDATVISIKPKK